jgi:TOBE domain
VVVAIRPEAFHVNDTPTGDLNVIAGEVELALFVGDGVDYRVTAGSQTLRARGGARSRFATGARVHLEVAPEDCTVLPAPGTDGDVRGIRSEIPGDDGNR